MIKIITYKNTYKYINFLLQLFEVCNKDKNNKKHHVSHLTHRIIYETKSHALNVITLSERKLDIIISLRVHIKIH